MLSILSAMLVMMESGSVPAAHRLDLSVDGSMARAELTRAVDLQPASQGPVSLARALSDCNPAMVGIEPGADRPAASQDLLICSATMLKDEPVGRAVLWLHGQTGLQVDLSGSRVYLNVRFAP